jgi:hypothetical protein
LQTQPLQIPPSKQTPVIFSFFILFDSILRTPRFAFFLELYKLLPARRKKKIMGKYPATAAYVCSLDRFRLIRAAIYDIMRLTKGRVLVGFFICPRPQSAGVFHA